MADETFPVFIEAQLSNGSTERVRVGSAVKSPDGFLLKLGEMTVGRQADAPWAAAAAGAPAARRPAAAGGAGAGDAVFPPYGRSKGQPVSGASMAELEYYAGGCKRSLADPSKARWHDKEKVLLAAIEAEIARQGGGGGGASSGFSAPASSSKAPAYRGNDDEPPPMTDDDIPF